MVTMKQFSVVYLVANFLFFLSLATANKNGTVDEYVALKELIYQRPEIKYKIPPKVSGVDDVHMSLCPFYIGHVDERTQAVGLALVMKFLWRLGDVTWDPANHSDVAEIEIHRDDVWTPSIAKPRSKSETFIKFPEKLRLLPTGVRTDVPGILETVCEFDISSFPFDSQNCTMPFIEMNCYNLVPSDCNADDELLSLRNYFSANTEWTILDFSCSQVRTSETGAYYVVCWFTMQRESIFYVTCILIPLGLMAAMTLCVFRFPAESGEKMSFLVSLFVSTAVFVDFVVDNVPRSMTQIPRLITLIMAIMINLVLCAVASAFVLRRYHEEQNNQNRESKSYEEQFKETPVLMVRPPHGRERECYKTDDSNSKSGTNNVLGKMKNMFILGKTSEVGVENNGLDKNNSEYWPVERGSNAPESSPKVKRSEREILPVCFKMTHTQMDRCFFWIFLVISMLVYPLICFL